MPDYNMPMRNSVIDKFEGPLTKKEIKKQAQAAFGRRPARLMKTVGKIEDAVDAGNYKKAKRLKNRADRLTTRIQKNN